MPIFANEELPNGLRPDEGVKGRVGQCMERKKE
jgi:hypothetical protein